jgi:hypothetical protein
LSDGDLFEDPYFANDQPHAMRMLSESPLPPPPSPPPPTYECIETGNVTCYGPVPPAPPWFVSALILMLRRQGILEMILVIGASVRLFSMFLQMVSSEGLNVFYWCCFARCGCEWQNAVKPYVPNGGPDENTDWGTTIPNVDITYQHVRLVPEVLIDPENGYSGPCLRGRRVAAGWQWLATFTHNWLGALRMHIYASSISLVISAVFLHYAASGHVNKQSDCAVSGHCPWPQFRPWNHTDMTASEYAERCYPQLPTHQDPTIDPWNDASYFIYVSAIMLVLSECFRTTSGLAYYWGILRTESSIPANHVRHRGPMMRWLCP